METRQAAQVLSEVVRADARLAAVWLFGSVARGSATADSDVDVAVLRSEPVQMRSLDDLTFELEDQLSRLLHREAQVIDVEGAPDDQVHRILRDGILLLDRNRARRIDFEVRSRNRHFDMTPIWREYRQGPGPVAMMDSDLIAKKLAFVETCIVELRPLARPDALETDVRERRFVEHTLQVAIQACQDVASHIVSDCRLGEPRTNQELMLLLASAGWLAPDLGRRMRQAIGFRNVVVHGYTAVDLNVMRDVLDRGLDDLTAFVTAIRVRLTPTEEP